MYVGVVRIVGEIMGPGLMAQRRVNWQLDEGAEMDCVGTGIRVGSGGRRRAGREEVCMEEHEGRWCRWGCGSDGCTGWLRI